MGVLRKPDDVTAEELFEPATERRILAWLVLAYVGLSGFSYALGHVPGFAPRVPFHWAWIWLLGPTSLAGIAGAGWRYAGGTVVLFVLVFGAVSSLRRGSAWCLAFGVAALAIWVFSCLLVMAAAV